MSILFKNFTIIRHNEQIRGDVLVDGEKILAIAPSIDIGRADVVIDGKNKLLLPGAIDSHTHFSLDLGHVQVADDYYTGTRAAACGGVTTIFDYPLTEKGERASDCAKRTIETIARDACVDFSLHVALCDVSDSIKNELLECIALGVTSFKAYMVYDFFVDDEKLKKLLMAAKETGALVAVHAEDKAQLQDALCRLEADSNLTPFAHYLSRDEQNEAAALLRLIHISEQLNAPVYIVHLACGEGVKAIADAKKRGVQIIAETCPQYLHFTNEVYHGDDGALFVCSPPIKGEASRLALWEGIKNGVISTIATDHCPFSREEKLRAQADFRQIPNGCGGVEVIYPYLLSCAGRGLLSYEEVVNLCSYQPAKIFGCSHKKGEIAVGKDADLVVYDPSAEFLVENKRLHGAADHTIWENTPLSGYPEQVYLRGKLLYEKGEFLGRRGDGKFLACTPK